MYRICWTVISTQFSGQGEYMFNYNEAETLLDHLTKNHPHMLHWIEKDPSVLS